MEKEINNLINYLRVNFTIGECKPFEETCPDCKASQTVDNLKWLLTLED